MTKLEDIKFIHFSEMNPLQVQRLFYNNDKDFSVSKKGTIFIWEDSLVQPFSELITQLIKGGDTVLKGSVVPFLMAIKNLKLKQHLESSALTEQSMRELAERWAFKMRWKTVGEIKKDYYLS